MKEINVVSDQIGSPTYACDLAKAILEILPQIKNEQVAIYHFANSGTCTWFEFAKAIFEIKGMEVMVHPILTSQYPTIAKRPNIVCWGLDKILMGFGICIPTWRDSLDECLKS